MLPVVLLILGIVSSIGARDFNSPLNPTKRGEFNDKDWEISKLMGLQNPNDENVVISPISLKVVMAVLLDASKGQTAAEIINYLGLNDTNIQTIREHFHELSKSLNEQTDSLTSAVKTKIFKQNSTSVNNNFINIMRSYYQTDLHGVDFSRPSDVAREINQWADQVSKGHIPNLVSEGDISTQAVMMILNVIYFNGLWESPFDEKNTTPGKFFMNENNAVNVKMMFAQQKLYYSQSYDNTVQIVRLPFMGGTFSMYFILPATRTGIHDAITSITPQRVYSLMNSMTLRKVNLTIPRFQFTYSIEVKPILEKLGVTTMFSNAADFSNMENGSHDLFVSKILQKSGIEVNEKGSSAYSATTAELHNKHGEDAAIIFNANRPFLFFIEEDKTDTVVFVGKVTKPQEEPITSTTYPSQTYPTPPHSPTSPSQQNSYEGTISGLADKIGGDDINKESIQFSYFDTDLAEVESHKSRNTNIVLAPASAKAILALLLQGATGGTANAIRSVLNLPTNKTQAEAQLKRMHVALKSASTKLLMKYSNAIFVANDLKLKDAFKTLAQEYNAVVTPVNFGQPQDAAQRINEWVKRYTDNIITEIIAPENIQKGARLVLLNAMLFKAKWMYQFPKTETAVGHFHINPTRSISAYMMNTKGYYRISYENWLHASVIQIPYQDPRFNFVVILPTRKDGIYELIKDVNHNTILEILDIQDHQEVKLSLPKFNIEYNTELTDTLTHMMKTNRLFSNSAELPNIAWNANGLKVDSIVHKAAIEVNEEGTKASAATGSSIVPLMTPITEYFIADHPFMFMVYNNEAKIILFEGVLHEPMEVNMNGNSVVPNQPSKPNLNTRTSGAPYNYQQNSTPADRNNPANQNIWQTQPSATQQHPNKPVNPQQQYTSQGFINQEQTANVQYNNNQPNGRPTQNSDRGDATTNLYSSQPGSTQYPQWPHTPEYTPSVSQVNNVYTNNNSNKQNSLQQTNNSNRDAITFKN